MRNLIQKSFEFYQIHLSKKYFYKTKSSIHTAHICSGLIIVDNKKLSIDLVKTAKFSANN